MLSQAVPPRGHHIYIVQPGDRTSEDVARHAWRDGDPEAGAWLTQYNHIDGMSLKPGQRLIVPDQPPSKAEMERAKRAVYPQEKKIADERYLASLPGGERERLSTIKREIDADPNRLFKTPRRPNTSASEFAAASARNLDINRRVRERLGLQNAQLPDGPVLERLEGPTTDGAPLYRATPQAQAYIRDVFKRLGIDYFPDGDIPILIRQLPPDARGYYAHGSNEITVAEWWWKSPAYDANYAWELELVAHEYLHYVQEHLLGKEELTARARREKNVLGRDRHRLLPHHLDAQKIDPSDTVEQQAMVVSLRVLKDFDAVTAMPAGLQPVRPWWLPS